MALTTTQKERLAQADEIIRQAKQPSQQPRFNDDGAGGFVSTLSKWIKTDFENTPYYSSDSRIRSKWLSQFWPTEPFIAGVINSVTQIDRNRGWTLTGGRNQVMRFQTVLHNWMVQPGRQSWREGCGAASLSFHTTDIGALVEIGRQFRDGPMVALYHLDPLRCVLTEVPDAPLKYYPSKPGVNSRVVPFTPTDFLRVASMVNVDETFHGLGYSALSRALDLSIIMVAVMRHEQEKLFARSPKGLLLLKGINKTMWDNSMKIRDAQLEQREQDWFGSVAVLASAGDADIDAKLFALSQLPDGFDQKVFTDLLMAAYALCFGYDVREFWPMSAGPLGSGNETITQARKASAKGGQEFALGLQEEITNNLPETLHFEFESRDTTEEMAEAVLTLAKVNAVNAMRGAMPGPMITDEQALELLAEEGIIPNEWTVTETDVEADDTETVRQRMMQYPEVQRAVQMFPDDELVMYSYPDNRVRSLMAEARHFSIPQMIGRLVEEIAAEPVQPLPPPPPAPEPVTKPEPVETPEERFRLADWLQLVREIGKPREAVNLTINNPQPVPASVKVENYLPTMEVTNQVNPTPIINEQHTHVEPTPFINEQHTHVEPTPLIVQNEVKNTVNVPAQAPAVVNFQTDAQAEDRKALLDEMRKLNG